MVTQVTNGHLPANKQAMFPTIEQKEDEKSANERNRMDSARMRRNQLNQITPIDRPETLSGWQ